MATVVSSAMNLNVPSAIDLSNPHCIVHIKRRNELTKEIRTKADNAVIAAWGSVEVLRNTATKLIELVPNLIGLKLDTPWYKYPSPYIKEQKLNWLTDIDAILKA